MSSKGACQHALRKAIAIFGMFGIDRVTNKGRVNSNECLDLALSVFCVQ